MERVNIKLLSLLMGVVILLLSACGSVGNANPGSGDGGVIGTAELVDGLREAGAQVEISGSVEQPFFPVSGQVLEVNGSQVQVFEFADQNGRRQVSDTISSSGDQIGTSLPSWIDQPNFWADGRLIVLYVGQNQSLIDLLSSVLGQPITEPRETGDLPPKAVIDGQRILADELGVEIINVQLIEVERMDWTDSCLGLGRPEEGCLAVITPGWRAIFEIDGTRYEVRTDETGEAIRWQLLDEVSVGSFTSKLSSLGEMIEIPQIQY